VQFYQQALHAFPHLKHRAALTILTAVPTPGVAQKLTRRRLVALLHRSGGRNDELGRVDPDRSQDRCPATVVPLPGARELLAHLHERQVPFAIATSGARHTARSALALLGLPDDVPVVTRDLAERA
jgi:beta-phosphoglucomutase-like phosphatase (HAD superfamily)